MHPNGRKREDVVKERNKWKENQGNLIKIKLYFLDETSINTGMVPLYAWGERGVRIEDYVPDLRFKCESLIATLSLQGINAPMTFKGTLNGDVFRAYLEQLLAPTLEPGDTVVLDNLSVHKVKDIIKPLTDKGIKVIYFF